MHVWRKNTERFSEQVRKRASGIIKEADILNDEEDRDYEGTDLPETGCYLKYPAFYKESKDKLAFIFMEYNLRKMAAAW